MRRRAGILERMSGPATTLERRPWLVLAGLLLLAALPKLAILLAPRFDLYLAGSRGIPQTWHGEEIHRGTTGVELLHGPILPVFDYHYAPFFGGSLVVGVVAVPLFAVLGTSVVVLKLVPLLFHLASIAALFFALRRLAGARAALLGGLLLAAPPPGYAVHTLTAFGTHVESNAFAMALLALFLALRDRAPGGPSTRPLAFAFGAIAGFGMYFGYIVVLALAALGLWGIVLDRRPIRLRDARWLFAGLLVGLLPWIAYNASHAFAGLSIYGRSLGGDPLPALARDPVGERLADLATQGYPGSAFFRPLGPLSGRAQELVYAFGVLVLAACALGTRRARRDESSRGEKAAFLLLQPLLFTVAYAVTGFKVGDPPDAVVAYRYVHVVWPWLFAAAAVVLDRWIERGGAARALSRASATLLVGLGLAGELALVDPARYGADFATPAYSYVAFGRFVLLSSSSEPEKILAAVDRADVERSSEELDAFLFGMGMQLKESQRPIAHAGPRLREFRERAESLRALLHDHVPDAYRPYFETLRPGEPAFGSMGRDERERFWEWHRQAAAQESEGE